jgi:DNA-binding NarL/FixJ family response regulator
MHLTGRETAILALIARGSNDRAIAALLGIQLSTARKHRENIVQKLGAGKAAILVWHYLHRHPDELKKSRVILRRLNSHRANARSFIY